MQNTIIIIESPNKCDKISKITGAKVYATKGHFKTLTNEIVKDYKNYEPIYEFKDNNTKTRMNSIFADCKNKDVIIATDPDREGYGIGYMVYEIIKNIAKSVKRAEFHEITESGIKKGLEKAVAFANSNLKEYESFQARVVGDKLVGFLLSPKYINILNDKNISVGRVQTPALSLIVKRELEIKEFENSKESKQIDYKIKVKLKTQNGVEFSAINDNLFNSKNEANQKIEQLSSIDKAKLNAIDTKQKEKTPPAPLRTSQLQEKANKKLGFSSDKTMNIAQDIFSKGLITYHRTDSNSLSSEFLDELENKFKNEEWYQKREYKAGSQSQAEAHEAIRISHAHDYQEIEQITQKENLNADEKALYELIYLNSIQSQAKSSIKQIDTYDFTINILRFQTKTSKTLYQGYQAVFKQENDEDDEENEEKLDLKLKQNDEVEIMGYELQEVKKQAPQHYKESNFISLLEKTGIGRPSTYATFLPTLLKRNYVEIQKKGKNSNIIATQKGIDFIKKIKESDDWISQSELTKDMEKYLDEISHGKNNYINYTKTLHEKLNFKELNTNNITPPSQKQIQLAQKLADELKMELPKDFNTDWKICSKFIEQAQKNKKPSEKQIKLAQDLAKDKNMELPKNYETDLKACKDFIDKAIKKK